MNDCHFNTHFSLFSQFMHYKGKNGYVGTMILDYNVKKLQFHHTF